MRLYLVSLLFLLFVSGCSAVVKVDNDFVHMNDTAQKKQNVTIVLLGLNNYTDTPQAGLRAANLVEGVLRSQEYKVVLHAMPERYELQEALQKATQEGGAYLLYGGVSEWRYKTGIDGEAAVSLMLSLVDLKTSQVVWSATASDTSWSNSSLGTLAQNLIQKMLVR